jgi:DNA-directed RNA polymerase subunit RPC12/RpoP
MSEFKYACPVCGQHIKCDSSQAGSQMECPTCFQKITVPQAPASEEQKFIITGSKKSERPVPTIPESNSSAVPAAKGFPGVLVVVIILICIGAAAAFVYRGTIFKSKNVPATESDAADESSQSPAKTQSPPRPAPVAPPASDANWTLGLEGMTNFPDASVAGRIGGQDFMVERVLLQNSTLTLRVGRGGPVNFGVQINFGGAQPEALAGQSLNVATNAPKAARVVLIWQDGGRNARTNFDGGYAMRLKFGRLAGSRLPGKIYLCAPDDQKSYIVGAFNAEIRRPKPKRPN